MTDLALILFQPPPTAEATLRQALKSRLSPEQRRRIEQIIADLAERLLSPEDRRAVRAVAVLARVHSPEVSPRPMIVRCGDRKRCWTIGEGCHWRSLQRPWGDL